MKHAMVQANGASFHTVETGHGAPLLFLHGSPEFWLTWEPVMARLANRYRLIAPDLRGFGDSDKPNGPFGAQDHAAAAASSGKRSGCPSAQRYSMTKSRPSTYPRSWSP